MMVAASEPNMSHVIMKAAAHKHQSSLLQNQSMVNVTASQGTLLSHRDRHSSQEDIVR